MMMYLDNYQDEISDLCLQNKVKSLYVFGSALSDQFTEQSDIDLIVDIGVTDPIEYADHYFNLKFGLQDLLKRRIDLLERKATKNPYLLQQIDRTKLLVYGE